MVYRHSYIQKTHKKVRKVCNIGCILLERLGDWEGWKVKLATMFSSESFTFGTSCTCQPIKNKIISMAYYIKQIRFF